MGPGGMGGGRMNMTPEHDAAVPEYERSGGRAGSDRARILQQ